jgi:TatD DNase family protein
MLIDSHCHLDKVDLTPYQGDFAMFMQQTHAQNIEHLLCIGIDLEAYPAMCSLVAEYETVSVTVGVHPNVREGCDPSVETLVSLGQDQKVLGIGETGLDYFRCSPSSDLTWQHTRFRNHIAAAKILKKPLIVHTRDAQQDTLRLLREENAGDVGGIIHCFTEDWAFAKQALDMNFYISFSGIVTFNNAVDIQAVAKKMPADRLLIETDSPYLAPVPFRGKPNYPHYVQYVAQQVANLRGLALNQLADIATQNFYTLFKMNG